jgi:hypothetical protein
MPLTFRRLAPVLVGLLAALPAAAADGVELRWQLAKGQTYAYLMKHHEVRTVEVGDQKFETTTDTEVEWLWTVKEVDDKGVAAVEMSMKALRLTANGRDYDFKYDSSVANTGAEAWKKDLIDHLDHLRAARYRLRIARNGEVKELTGFDKVIADHPPGSSVHDTNALTLRDGPFGWFLRQSLGVLPDAAVAEGGTWKRPVRLKLEGFGEMTGETEYRLDKPAKVGETPCQVVRFKGTPTLDLDMKLSNVTLAGPLKITKLEGAVRFDPKAGVVRESEYKTEMAGDLKLNDSSLKLGFRHTVTWELK